MIFDYIIKYNHKKAKGDIRMKMNYCNINRNILLIISLLMIFVYFAPIIVMRENSFHGIHDNLDSNHINSIIDSRNSHQYGFNNKLIPQLMGGLPIIPGPNLHIISLLYYLFPGYNALLINILLVHLIAFFGMLLLLKYIAKDDYNKNRTIYFLVALAFALVRFWENAGISIAGLPLLFYGFLVSDRKKIVSILLAFIYAFYSNFVLAGMFALIVLGIIEIIIDCKRKKINWYHWAYLFLVFLFYLISSYKLIISVFSSVPLFISHRQDYNMVYFYFGWKKAIKAILQMIFVSYGHNSSFPSLIMIISIFLIIYCRVKHIRDKRIEYIFIIIIGISILSGILNTNTWMSFQQHIPYIKMIQLQRFYWLLSFFHYLLFFYALLKLCNLNLKWLAVILSVLQILFLFSWNSNYRQLAKKYIFNRKDSITYSEFYSADLLEDIRKYIGKPQSSYRIVSVGLEPAVALYSGFYTLEGYQSNYPIEHKRKMQEVMANELAKNEYLRNNFNGWGNKVTIYSDDIDRKIGYPSPWNLPIIKKGTNVTIDDLSINTEILKNMNCHYLISALMITNPSQTGLTFLKDFVTTNSLYKIYLYKIE